MIATLADDSGMQENGHLFVNMNLIPESILLICISIPFVYCELVQHEVQDVHSDVQITGEGFHR